LRESNRLLKGEIRDRKQAEAEKEKMITELKAAIQKVKTLSGLLPICSSCKMIRGIGGSWRSILKNILRRPSATGCGYPVRRQCLVPKEKGKKEGGPQKKT